MRKQLGLWWLLLLFLLLNCNETRFTGFSYDAEQLANTAQISGQINNVFTGEPVKGAQISFDGQLTQTDGLGLYDTDYFVDADDKANRLVPVKIDAAKYYSLESGMVVFPVGNVANFQLIYGAPLVLSAEITPDTVARGIIFDYQGFDNIDSVFVSSLYEPTMGPSGRNFWFEMPMTFVRQIDENSAEYTADIPKDLGRLIINRLKFRITDKDKFEEYTIIIF